MMTRPLLLILAVAVGCAHSDAAMSNPDDTLGPGAVHRYTTAFPATESPLSEGGRWLNGRTDGTDWSDVSSSSGVAIGHQTGASYTDATALLKGEWGPNQRATATVFATTTLLENCYSEVELRLRSTLSPRRNRGYEVSFKVSQTDAAYLIIVRWNGALGDFSSLFKGTGVQYAIQNGDVISATIVGDTITAYRNGDALARVTDHTFASGSPGMGFNLENGPAECRGTNDRYGYRSFEATDSIAR
jgi:hypothetical protein